ncbi:MAG: helix-turn-helix domain-containing protein [Spirochaetes bacterium]|nr:helix-turn-helix domain-containing protein [Spirochaetota bacterium]
MEIFSHRNKVPPFAVRKTDLMESFPPHGHDFIELTYIFEGTGTQKADGELTRVTARQMLLLPPGSSHEFVAVRGRRHRQASIAIYPEFFSAHGTPRAMELIDGMLDGGSRLITLPADLASDVEESIDTVLREFIFRIGRYERVIALEMERLFINLERARGEAPAVLERYHQTPPVVYAALTRIESLFYSIESLEDLVPAGELSKKHFIALFKRHLGLTPIQYLIRVRLEKCCGALATSGVPITEAAHQCGFNDLGYFNLQFKAHTGMSPREFRKRSAAGLLRAGEVTRFAFPLGGRKA